MVTFATRLRRRRAIGTQDRAAARAVTHSQVHYDELLMRAILSRRP